MKKSIIVSGNTKECIRKINNIQGKARIVHSQKLTLYSIFIVDVVTSVRGNDGRFV